MIPMLGYPKCMSHTLLWKVGLCLNYNSTFLALISSCLARCNGLPAKSVTNLRLLWSSCLPLLSFCGLLKSKVQDFDLVHWWRNKLTLPQLSLLAYWWCAVWCGTRTRGRAELWCCNRNGDLVVSKAYGLKYRMWLQVRSSLELNILCWTLQWL